MDVHPFIAALRRDRSPQRHAQSAMEDARNAWRKEPGAAEMLADLERFGEGAPLEACGALEKIFEAAGEGERMMGLLSRHYCRALAANPIGHPPFRYGFDGRSSSILLARAGRADLMLQAREPGRHHAKSYVFTDAIRFEAVLAGKASARIVRKRISPHKDAFFDSERLNLSAGTRLAFDLSSEALVIDSVEQRLVVLRLVRNAAEPEPALEHDAENGRLLHQSAGHISTSRTEAIIALLGRMGRTDAAPQLERIAASASDDSLRWQALRECLALDSVRGFRILARIAGDGMDPLAGPAGALRAQLVEAYPELADLETSRCHG